MPPNLHPIHQADFHRLRTDEWRPVHEGTHLVGRQPTAVADALHQLLHDRANQPLDHLPVRRGKLGVGVHEAGCFIRPSTRKLGADIQLVEGAANKWNSR